MKTLPQKTFFSVASVHVRLATYSEAPLDITRRPNSVLGTENSANPQFKQTRTCGKIIRVGLLRPFHPGKWTFISTPNSCWLSEAHCLQAMATFRVELKKVLT